MKSLRRPLRGAFVWSKQLGDHRALKIDLQPRNPKLEPAIPDPKHLRDINPEPWLHFLHPAPLNAPPFRIPKPEPQCRDSWSLLQASSETARTVSASSEKPEPETRNPEPEARNPKPETRNPKFETRNPKPETQNPKPKTVIPAPSFRRAAREHVQSQRAARNPNPNLEPRNPKPETRNQKPETRNPRPEIRIPKPETAIPGPSPRRARRQSGSQFHRAARRKHGHLQPNLVQRISAARCGHKI